MANLAIKGHATRGREVIELLEMLGGINKKYRINFTEENLLYTIREGDDAIIATYPNTSINKIFTLEQFLEKYPYKVGDKVNSPCKGCIKTITSMEWDTCLNTVTYKLDNRIYTNVDQLKVFNDLQPHKEKTMENKPDLLQQLKEYFDNTPREVVEKEWHEYDKYNEIGPTVDEYLEYVNKIRQPQYPKTYEECCEVLGVNSDNFLSIRNFYQDDGDEETTDYEEDLLDKFNYLWELLICRDAYWKIAGEQLGLGKPWGPDWTDSEFKYCIKVIGNKIECPSEMNIRCILSFPIKEMRDAFFENFKELIEKCKEFL